MLSAVFDYQIRYLGRQTCLSSFLFDSEKRLRLMPVSEAVRGELVEPWTASTQEKTPIHPSTLLRTNGGLFP